MGEQVIDLVCILIVVLHKHCKNIWKQLTYICEIICYSLHKLIHLISICMESRESRESTTVWSNLMLWVVSVRVWSLFWAVLLVVMMLAGELFFLWLGDWLGILTIGISMASTWANVFILSGAWDVGCVRPHKDAIWDIGENVDRCD